LVKPHLRDYSLIPKPLAPAKCLHMEYGTLILTQDEDLNIDGCLESLRGRTGQLVVIDSGSKDSTLDKVRNAGLPVTIIERKFVSFSDQRNHGLDNYFAPGTWVLHLDADERLTPALANELSSLPGDGPSAAWNIPSMTYFRGRRIPRASGYPVYQTRLTRAGDFRFVEIGHGQKAPPSMTAIPRLRQPYEHHPFEKGLRDWLARHDRYSSREAQEWLNSTHTYTLRQAMADPIARRQWLKRAMRVLPGAPALTYFYLLVLRGGFLEGREGRDYCRMRYLYEHLIVLKYHELLGTAK